MAVTRDGNTTVSRGQGGLEQLGDFRPFRQLSYAGQLRTLELYLRHQNSHVVGRILGLDPGTIRARLKVMGVKLRGPGDHISDVTELNGGRERVEAALRQLRYLAEEECRTQELLGLQAWTSYEDEFLAVTQDDVEAVQHLNRTVAAVAARRIRLLREDDRLWTDEELALLLADNRATAEIANDLSRSPTAVEKMRREVRDEVDS